MAIDWERLSAKKVEDLISSLLNQLHPDRAQRIDGSGGDGGRDVQIVEGHDKHLFEIKSHTGRMRSTRRRQVERSLERAKTLNPTSWTLLVPVDPNPTELKWFERLQAATPFPIKWQGRNWLDTEIAQRPYLERYWVAGEADKVKELLTLARQEEAGLARGAVDALERVRRVVDLLNGGDPYYRYNITSDGESSSVTPIPRYRGAENDHPIEFNAELVFPNTPEGQAAAAEFQNAIDFGTPARIHGTYIRKFESRSPVTLLENGVPKMIEMQPLLSGRRALPLIFGIVTPDGRSLGELPIAGVVTSTGERGAKIEGRDRGGVVFLTLTLDKTEQRASGNVDVVHPKVGFFANELLDPIRLLKHAVRPNVLEFRTIDGISFLRGPAPWDESPVEDGFDQFLEDLVLIQWASRMNRPVGPGFDREEVAGVTEAARLLRGETVSGTWNEFHITMKDDAEMASRRVLVGEPRSMRLVKRGGVTVTVAGVEYRVGEAIETIMDSVVLAPEHLADSTDGIPVGVAVRFVPGTTNRVARRLVTADALPAEEPEDAETEP
jgi:hypothetical protein